MNVMMSASPKKISEGSINTANVVRGSENPNLLNIDKNIAYFFRVTNLAKKRGIF